MKSTNGITSHKFLIKDLTGTSGRLDIIFRCILAAFSFGKGNIFFHTVLCGPPNPPKSLEFIGNQLDALPIDEIRMAKQFQNLLDSNQKDHVKGITLATKSFLNLASELAQKGPLLLLQENSLPIWEYLNEIKEKKTKISSLIFVLSDHIDLDPDEKEFLMKQLGAIPVGLGSQSYLASHCITFLLMELKKYEF